LAIMKVEGVAAEVLVHFPRAIVLTQECDLLHDYTTRTQLDSHSEDKLLLSVLVAPVYNAGHVFRGEHMSELGFDWRMQAINEKRTEGKYIKTNRNPRYQYLEFPEEIPIPAAIIDFKHYFSVRIEHLLSREWICGVAELYRESITQRFASFLSRIGLPDPGD